jgi:hypothetical protein
VIQAYRLLIEQPHPLAGFVAPLRVRSRARLQVVRDREPARRMEPARSEGADS